MTSRQILTATAILALVAGATAADAAPRRRKPAPPKPVCKVIQDPAGDATEALGASAPTDPALDLVSADVASNATHVTAVWRVLSLAGNQTSWPVGRAYQLVFMAHGKQIVLNAAFLDKDRTLWHGGQGAGVIDAAKNEIRMTVPIASLSEKFKPGEKLTELGALSFRNVAHQNYKVARADAASGVKPFYYQASYPSCVKVGA